MNNMNLDDGKTNQKLNELNSNIKLKPSKINKKNILRKKI